VDNIDKKWDEFIKAEQKGDYILQLEQQILEAQKYATDAHAGEVRDITPLQALQEQAEYYEDMMDEMEAELKKYGRHLPGCTYMPFGTQCFHTGVMLPGNLECTCGFEEVSSG
jgi:hypothetical protein